jgi:hypothetical protein
VRVSRAFDTDNEVRTLLSIQGCLENFDVDVNLVDVDSRGVQRLHNSVAECNQIRMGIEKIVSRYREVINYIQCVTRDNKSVEKTIDVASLRVHGFNQYDVDLYGVDSIYVSMYGNFTITFSSDYVESLLRDDILKAKAIRDSGYDGYGDYGTWELLLKVVAQRIEGVLGRLYVVFVMYMMSPSVSDEVWSRYANHVVSSVYHGDVVKMSTIYADIDVEYCRVTNFSIDTMYTFNVSPIEGNQYKLNYCQNTEFCYDIRKEELSSEEVDGVLHVLETLAYLHDMVLDNVDGEYAFNVRADGVGQLSTSFLSLHRKGALAYGTKYIKGCAGEFDENDYKVSLTVHVNDLFTKVMASRVFTFKTFYDMYLKILEEFME